MTNTIITAFLCAWAIAGLFSIAFIRGSDERRQQKRKTEWRRA